MKDIRHSNSRWAISISDEISAIAALVLAESLKRVHTIGMISGLIEPGSSVCDRIRTLLKDRLPEVIDVVPFPSICSNSEESLRNPEESSIWTKLDANCLVLRNCDELLEHNNLHNLPLVGNESALFLENPSTVKIVKIEGIKLSPYLSIYRTLKLPSIFEQAIWDYWWGIYRLEVKPYIEGNDNKLGSSQLTPKKFDCLYDKSTPSDQLLLVSAQSEVTLKEKLKLVQESLLQNGSIMKLSELENSSSNSTSHFKIKENGTESSYLNRIAIYGKDINEMLHRIQEGLLISSSPICNQEKKVCFLFTGQGCAYENMGKILYESCHEYKFHVDYCYSIVLKKFGISLTNSPKDISRMSGYLQNLYSNLPTFIVQYSLFKTWEAWGVKPDYILSHSLGEFAGSVAAGFMSCEDGLSLIVTLGKSARFLKQNASMVVMKADELTAINLINKFSEDERIARGSKGGVEFVAINSHTQVVLAGPTEVIRKFVEWCSRNGITIRMFPSLLAFHTSMLEPIHHQQVKIAGAFKYMKPEPSKYISGMRGEVVENMDGVFWADHEEKTVQFMKGCETAFKKNCNVFLEIGPRPLLSSLVASNKEYFGVDGEMLCLPSLKQNEDDCSVMLNSLGNLFVNGVSVDLSRFHHV